MNLCAAHRAEWDQWLDYRLPPRPVQLIVIGGRPEDARKLRADTWRQTIRRQQELVVAACGATCPAR